MSSFLRYYPVRIKNIGMDAFFDRQVIYDFKDGRNHADVAKCVAKMLVKKFGRKVRSVVFSCVPASSQERNEARNKNFSELVCKFSGAINGFSHVKVVGERTAFHGTKVKKDEREKNMTKFDKAVSAAFTGHRFYNFSQQEVIRERLTKAILEPYEHGISSFISGFAIGIDLMAAQIVHSLKPRLSGRMVAWRRTQRFQTRPIVYCFSDEIPSLS